VTRAARFVLVFAVALAIVPAASAQVIEAIVGDTIDVVGTKVGCIVVQNKYKAINCFLANRQGLIGNRYGISISGAGTASVTKVSATKKCCTQIWKRTKTGARAVTPQYFRVITEDSFILRIKGGYLGCKVFDLYTGSTKLRGRKIECWRATATKPFPLTYGVSLSDTYARAFEFDAKGNRGKTLVVHFQPKK
jgi:hypothetical protein